MKVQSLKIFGTLFIEGAYKVGTRSGRLNVLLHRDQIENAGESDFIVPEDVPNVDISIREAAKAEAPGGGQGFLRCSCSGQCKTNVCKCR